jgi:RNA ligase (TIGR02306 family)
MLNLATIQEITDIQPIQGKDLIGLANVLGWYVIVRKDSMKVGDKVVYVEIDSVLPDKPEFEDIKKRSNLRIKTMKMAGVISQGICFPLSILPEGNHKVGDDVTQIMGVTKYDPEVDIELQLKNRIGKDDKQSKFIKLMLKFAWFRKLYLKSHKNGKESFPAWIKKTDETRLQNMPFVLKTLDKHIVTEKLDGQSGTYAMKHTKHPIFFWKENFEFIVCSRNLRLPEDNSNYWRIAKQFNIESTLKKLLGMGFKNVVLQGEILGSNIQGNKYKLPSGQLDFYAFNVIMDGVQLNSVEAEQLLKVHGIKFVPILDKEFYVKQSVQDMVQYANGKSQLVDDLREGLVIRNYHNFSFKVISPEFLLKHGL